MSVVRHRGFTRVGKLVRVAVIADTGQPCTRNSGALHQCLAASSSITTTGRDGPMIDRYDRTGEAAVWQAAAELVSTPEATRRLAGHGHLERRDRAGDPRRRLDTESRGIRQRGCVSAE